MKCGCVDTTLCNPNTPDSDVIINQIGWVLDDSVRQRRGHFCRDARQSNRDNRVPPEPPQWQSQPMTMSEGGLLTGTWARAAY